MSKKLILYHVTHKYLGEEVLMQPRIPISAAVNEDRTIPRICVCDDIKKCLIGLTSLHLKDIMYVYKALKPKGIDWDSPRRYVDDWDVSEEVWLTEPNNFKFLYPIRVYHDIFVPATDVVFKKLNKTERTCLNEMECTFEKVSC